MNQSQKINKRKVGAFYEQAAAQHLMENGLIIVEKNYRCSVGEIDIIALDRDTLVFVEVKYRKTTWSGGALASVNQTKQRTISKTAMIYLLSHGWYPDYPCRFDVIGFNGDTLLWIRNAFDTRFN